jgi:Protein of unknown function (DUF1302)
MSKKIGSVNRSENRKFARLRRLGLSVPAVLAAAPAAHALQLYDGSSHGNNVEVNLNITTSYTGLFRVQQPSAILVSGASNANGNDGDANLRHGVVGNTFEVLPVLDIKSGSFGMHFSGEYFINTVYLHSNQNNQPGSVNPNVTSNTNFANQTRTANGTNGRLLDAFVYDSWSFNGGQQITLKAGQQTLFWGQSLFFGTNGIAGGQAPIDVVSASNLVNPQTQQIFLPVGQVVATYQPNSVYTIQGYYQYQWEPYALNGVGSYFSTSDVTGPGGYRLIAENGNDNSTFPGSNNLFLIKNGKDLTPPSQNGQFGLSVQAQYGNYDVGLFGLRYDNKTPNVYINAPTGFSPTPGGTAVGQYKLVYSRDIWLYGTSVSTTIGATNVAGELSMRTHMPLVGSAAAGMQTPGDMGDANSNQLVPIGNTMTGLASWIYGSPALRFDPGGITFLGEVEYVDVFRVTDNKALLAPGRTASAMALNTEVEPAYFEVLPNLELQFPLQVKYNFVGNSQMDSTMNHGTGNWSVGVVATYRESWDASLTYVGYFGQVGTNPLQPEIASGSDRGYLSLNLQHTF